jgi:hypothetical protein
LLSKVSRRASSLSGQIRGWKPLIAQRDAAGMTPFRSPQSETVVYVTAGFHGQCHGLRDPVQTEFSPVAGLVK